MLILESNDLHLMLIHIPKTAGTSLRHLLLHGIRRKYKDVEIKEVKCWPKDQAIDDKVQSNRSQSIANYKHVKNQKIISSTVEVSSTDSLFNIILGISTKENRTDINYIKENPSTICNKKYVKTMCYGYWYVSNKIDLAHIPRRFISRFYPPEDKYSNIDYNDYYCISCVRNPYSRIFSAYSWYQRERRRPINTEEFNSFIVKRLPLIVADYHRQFNLGEVPSSEFIHFMPMWMMLADYKGDIKYNFIIRQETFSSDVLMLMDRLKLPLNRKSLTNGLINHHKTTGGRGCYDHINHYNHLTLKVIEILYNRDFKLFGYRFIS